MISKLIEASKLWDSEHCLPTIPIHNNPRMYTALVFKFVKASGEPIPLTWQVAYLNFAAKCYRWEREVQIVSRWPGGRGGNFSHDEILGDSCLLSLSATQHLCNLRRHYGIYPDANGKLPLSRWFYRFIFLRPYLKAEANQKLPWWERIQWSAHVWLQARKTKREKFDADGLFKTWLMIEKMIAHCPRTCEAWLSKMEREGITPKLLFQDYLKEVSMADYAPESFRSGL